MARSKITKKVKLSRHRRRHRRKSTRSGGSPARRSLSRSSSSHSTPHHNQEREFLERLRVSKLKFCSLESFADLARAYSGSTNVSEKISNIVEKSSCGKAHTISDLINLASESGQISGTKQITKSEIDEIFKDCMIGLDKIDAAVVLRLCIKDFFGPCQKQSGGKYKGTNPQRLSNPGHGRWTAAEIDRHIRNEHRGRGSSGEDDCCKAILLIGAAFFVMAWASEIFGRFAGQ